ncbi:DNA polymerase III subunit beta [Candidatus Woesebacteria bacterium GWC2_33_12]|uniref:Beta sliding clamp n=1 Tax=Candidatus Woesebacteria bacterium GW2011_GWB1_33_22 TaxID=1618566 RepID=A0A0F9ZJA5_9BACT|nr:MAG: polymerase III, beta subunit protein [Candidatus Woesebacteria bacterium GW2011_GWC2_33_12]KKP41834.1 MAG: polymerase III, beta subunit protein [Candidatus Woesebacteria bacterium GW2011_GWA2_33_20]KKP44308.1 MAG: polymerase III, beta subunit protein [Candidatus Woesebacteria bacterium GW2011_GWB1_33_22]KKP46066.1 MAG: polymerase III, beta subunit protein [Microgenomates group bacterium GW2011_GWC1_33_28]KKP49956.1 MAG: polymerase III, beta subunit protein [Candidatus Woesebacteria bact
MKLTLLQENLKKYVNLVSHFISNKTQLPILSNILIQTDKSKLTLSATNLENSITTTIAAKIEKEGEITVNGKVFNEIITNLSSGPIDLGVLKEQIILTSFNFKSKILGSNTSDFPKLPKNLGKKPIVFEKDEFIKSLSKVLFSVSLDESRPILTGVLFVLESGNLSLVATDGFRLSEIKLKNKITSDDFSLIIPKSILNEIVRIEEDGNIEMSYDKDNNQVLFKIEDILLSSRVIEGSFPDYKKIIPKTSENVINIDKFELEKAIKLSSVFARDAGNIIKLKIKDQNLKVTAESANAGSQETEIEIRTDSDTELAEVEIMFNFKFIEEVLKVIENDEVQIKITGQNTSAIFLDSKFPNFLHLIMPIKSQN